jgi:thioredoxin reductase
MHGMTGLTKLNNEKTSPSAGAGRAVDVVVAGGGLAGLAGALTLGRARRSVLVVDAGRPRNAPAAHAHGYLTRDGAHPLELLATGRAEIASYGGEIIAGSVTGLARLPGGHFRVTLADGTSRQARRVLVATGLVDEYPDIPGLRERWGRDVVHCPYCFGWELRDAPLGVLATGPQAATQALMWRQWSPDVALFLHTAPSPSGDQLEQLAARGISVIEGEVTGVQVTGDRLSGVRLRSGQVIPRRALVVGPRFEARHALLDELGVTVTEHPRGIGHQVAADATGLTAAAGVWVAGNAADVTAGVMQAAASGVTAAAAINADLIAEDTAAAVEAWRAARKDDTAAPASQAV